MDFDFGIILAAGRGSRMGKLTNEIPKPLLPRSDDSLIDRQIRFLRPHVKNLGVTYGYFGEKVKEKALSLGADFAIDTSNRGNSFFLLSQELEEARGKRIVVLTCDNLMQCDVSKISQLDLELKPGITIVGVRANQSYLGDRLLVDEDFLIEDIGPNVNSNILASGLQILDYDLAKAYGLEDFRKVWQRALESGRLRLSRLLASSWDAFDTEESLSRFPAQQKIPLAPHEKFP